MCAFIANTVKCYRRLLLSFLSQQFCLSQTKKTLTTSRTHTRILASSNIIAEANLRVEVVIISFYENSQPVIRFHIVDCGSAFSRSFHRKFCRRKIFVLKQCILLEMPVKLFPFPNFSLRVLLLQRNVFEFIQGFYTNKVNREVRDVKK